MSHLSLQSAGPFPPVISLTHSRPAHPSSNVVSATILTKNSAALLRDVLAALEWCAEVVVLDTGSTDATLAIAAEFANVSLHQITGPFPGFGRAHQLAAQLARHDWILSVDSDEIVTSELREEIAALSLDVRSVYVISFRNYFNGRLITTCGWSPDRHPRLFHRQSTNFCASAVHEKIGIAHLRKVHLRGPIRHHSYRSLNDFLRKMSSYSRLFAEQNVGRKRSGAGKAITRSGWAFFKSYFFQRGVLQGAEGLVISVYKAQTVFWKYMMLHEANEAQARSPAAVGSGGSRPSQLRTLAEATVTR
jgi:glycosyltransferase involved in cell wall biosynthesis